MNSGIWFKLPFALLLYFSFSIWEPLCAQTKSLRFERLGINEGLSHSAVTSVYQDRQGFLWIATHGGLNKYDGYKITQFRNENWNPKSIPTNSILSVYQDKNRIVWLGTLGHGLLKYQSDQNAFVRYSPDSSPTSITDVYNIVEDAEGTIWLNTNYGLCQFDIAKSRIIHIPVSTNTKPFQKINDIIESADGDIWVATESGVYKFNNQTQTLQMVFELDAAAICWEKQNMLWIGSGENLFLYDATRNKMQRFDSPTGTQPLEGTIADLSKFGNDLWIATDKGVSVIDQKTKSVNRYQYSADDPFSLGDNSVLSFYKDKSNVLWIATNGGGVSKTNLARKQFYHIHRTEIANTLSHNNVFALEEDHHGNIWIGTVDGGLNRFNPKTNIFTHFLPDETSHSISSRKILSLDIGESGNLWIGTDLDGLCMAEKNDLLNKAINFRKYNEGPLPSGLSYNVIYTVLETNKHTVWAGTWSKGLNKMDFEISKNGNVDYSKPTVTIYEYDHKNPRSISHNVIFKLFQDGNENLWVGTAGGGLNRFFQGSAATLPSFQAYNSVPSDSTSISDNFVSAFYESPYGDFWIGTTTGLNKMDRSTGKFNSYTVKDGLPSNVVFGIQGDREGNLWLATHAGLSKFNPRTETFRNYTIDDGLQGNVFNPDASLTSKSGMIYFGGTNGITSFFPDSIQDNAYLPEVIITDYTVFSRSGQKKATSEFPVDNNPITLHADDYVIKVEFASTAFAVPKKNQFAYKLEGFDPDWIFTDADHRFATYTNLDAGNYVLKIKTSNEDGLWNEQSMNVKLSVLPPFWQTLWFRMLAVCSIGSLLFAVYYWRIRTIRHQKQLLERLVFQRTNEILAQKEEIEAQKENIEEKNILLENQQLHLEKLVEERTLELLKKNMELTDKNQRFEQYGFMTSHNFRGPVATLLGLCHIFNRKDLSDRDNLMFIEKIEETTRKIDEMIRDISTLLNQESKIEQLLIRVDLEEVILRVKSLLEDELRSSGATVKVNFKNAPVIRAVPAYITSIFYNLISNAIKFRKENTRPLIEIESIQRDRFVVITVKDNGAGIDLKKHAAYIFHPFKRFHEHVPGKGLGLYLVKTQLKAMEGDIHIESEAEVGTTFKLSFKVEHEN